MAESERSPRRLLTSPKIGLVVDDVRSQGERLPGAAVQLWPTDLVEALDLLSRGLRGGILILGTTFALGRTMGPMRVDPDWLKGC